MPGDVGAGRVQDVCQCHLLGEEFRGQPLPELSPHEGVRGQDADVTSAPSVDVSRTSQLEEPLCEGNRQRE